MENLILFLSSWIGDPHRATWVFMGVVAALTFGVGAAGMALAGALLDPVRGRARALLTRENAGGGTPWARMGEKIAPYVLPTAGGKREGVRRRLMHAGFRSEAAVGNFYAAKTLMVFGLPLVALLCLSLMDTSSKTTVLGAAWAMVAGFLLPDHWLKSAVKRRKRVLYQSMPDALDLLVVCTEAGHGLKQAIQRVADELQETHPELAGELALVNAEMRAGVDRVEALRHLADRTDLADIGGLVSLLAQSLRFGTSVADALRIYSEEFRDKRTQRAEEVAATLSTRMVFPLVTCMFPAFFLVAIGPAVVGVIGALGN